MYPDVEHAEPHRTGHRWVDLTVAGCALLISAISLTVAVMHGRTMERMADANARLVAANSWPILQFSHGNTSDAGAPQIELRVENSGVGPAKIESFEVWWRGQPLRNDADLLARCCGWAKGKSDILVDQVGQRVLEAHKATPFLTLNPTHQNEAIFERLNLERFKLTYRACYCSVFDECWLSDLQTMHPVVVKVCPKPKVPFGL